MITHADSSSRLRRQAQMALIVVVVLGYAIAFVGATVSGFPANAPWRVGISMGGRSTRSTPPKHPLARGHFPRVGDRFPGFGIERGKNPGPLSSRAWWSRLRLCFTVAGCGRATRSGIKWHVADSVASCGGGRRTTFAPPTLACLPGCVGEHGLVHWAV